MKKLRKTVTLLLALVTLLSVFAMPAMAAGAAHDHVCDCQSEIQPRYAIGPCYYCGGRTVYSGMELGADKNWYTIATCLSCGRTCRFAN